MSEHSTDPQPQRDTFGEAYDARLVEAIAVLTAAARIPRPRMTQTPTGEWAEDPTAGPDQMDWAEFVTLALAGAAANIGGIDAILTGRSGSWEAAGVRQLLESTVGTDEARLWEYRTEPINITLYVDELVVDHAHEAYSAYDAAAEEILRRIRAVDEKEPPIDYDRFTWSYDRTPDGGWIGRTPETPAWSWDAWRSQPWRDYEVNSLDTIEEQLRSSDLIEQVYIAKSREAAEQMWRLEDERDAKLGVFAELEEQLEEQRIREWTAYGEALKARIEAVAGSTPGLQVPVNVTVDVQTFRRLEQQQADQRFWNSLESRLIESALMDTPTPADLPGTPLDRL